MKTNKFLAILLLALTLVGCNKAKTMDEMLSCVPDNAGMVVTLNPLSVFESFGCEIKDGNVTDIQPLEQALPEKYPSMPVWSFIANMKSLKGVDLSKVVFFSGSDNKVPTLLLCITNTGKFADSLIELNGECNHSKKNGYDILSVDEKNIIIVSDGIGYLVDASGVDNAVEKVKQIQAQAKTAPLSAWKKDALKDGKTISTLLSWNSLIGESAELANSINMLMRLYPDFAEKLKDSYIINHDNLDGQKFEFSVAFKDKDGNDLKWASKCRKVDPSLARFASKDDVLLAFVNLPEDFGFAQVKQQLEMMGLDEQAIKDSGAKEIIESLNGNMMFAAGTAINSMNVHSTMDIIHYVCAFSTKPGKSEMIANNFVNMMKKSTPELRVEKSGNGFCLTVPTYDILSDSYDYNSSNSQYYIITTPDAVVLSSAPVSDKGGCPVKFDKDCDDFIYAVMSIDRNNQLLKMLNLQLDVNAHLEADNEGLEAEISAVGNDKDMPLLQTIFTALKDM